MVAVTKIWITTGNLIYRIIREIKIDTSYIQNLRVLVYYFLELKNLVSPNQYPVQK